MQIEVLGCSGIESATGRTSSLLLDGRLLLDAGAVISAVPRKDLPCLLGALITHPHLDHVAGLAGLSVCMLSMNNTFTVAAPEPVNRALREHLFNGVIWPDLSFRPDPKSPAVWHYDLPVQETIGLFGFDVRAVPVSHPGSAYAYTVSSGGSKVLFSGDTRSCPALWETMDGTISAAFLECSFPSRMARFAEEAGHMTPAAIADGLRIASRKPPRILINHILPQFREEILREFGVMDIEGLEIPVQGGTYSV